MSRWEATFEPVGIPEEEAVELIRGIFQAGLGSCSCVARREAYAKALLVKDRRERCRCSKLGRYPRTAQARAVSSNGSVGDPSRRRNASRSGGASLRAQRAAIRTARAHSGGERPAKRHRSPHSARSPEARSPRRRRAPRPSRAQPTHRGCTTGSPRPCPPAVPRRRRPPVRRRTRRRAAASRAEVPQAGRDDAARGGDAAKLAHGAERVAEHWTTSWASTSSNDPASNGSARLRRHEPRRLVRVLGMPPPTRSAGRRRPRARRPRSPPAAKPRRPAPQPTSSSRMPAVTPAKRVKAAARLRRVAAGVPVLSLRAPDRAQRRTDALAVPLRSDVWVDQPARSCTI